MRALYQRKLQTFYSTLVEANYHLEILEGFKSEKKVKWKVVTIYYIDKEHWEVPTLTNDYIKVYKEGKYGYNPGKLCIET